MTPKFKELQDKWYKKLKASGFDDIEQDEERLKTWSSAMLQRSKIGGHDWADYAVSRQAAEEYYILAGQFLHSHKFKNERERKIWTLHSEGVGFRDIAKKFKSNKDSINRLVKVLVQEMFKENRAEREANE